MGGDSTTQGPGPLAVLLRDLRRRRMLTQKQLADVSLVAERTVQGLEKGTTRTPQFRTLQLLADALTDSAEERAELFRVAYPTAGHTGEEQLAAGEEEVPASEGLDEMPPSEGGGETAGVRARRWGRGRISTVFGALVLVSGGTVLGVQLLSGDTPPNAGVGPALVSPAVSSSAVECQPPQLPPTTVTSAATGGVWPGRIVNTWSKSRCKDMGVLRRDDPRRSKADYPGLFTGTPVTITCYYDKGRETPDNDTGRTSTLWYRLDNGYWYSSIFVEVGGRLNQPPPTGMPACPP